MVPARDQQRLEELCLAERAGERLPQLVYRLTAEGRTLLAALAPLDAWAKRWAGRG